MIRKRTRNVIINIAIFWTILVVITYVNRQPSDDKTFQWTTITYKTTAKSLPEPHGTCPGLKNSKKPALVVGRMSYENATWLEDLKEKYHLCVYTADTSPDDNPPSSSKSWSWTQSLTSAQKSIHLQVPANRGHESMAYLTFIIDNYDHIPPSGAVFIHGNRYQWHNDAQDYDNLYLLNLLNVSAALEPSGYHNLRCDWSAGTCSPKEASPQNSMETLTRSMLEQGNVRAVSDAKLPGALVDLFGPSSSSTSPILLGRTDAIRSQCCAQFTVSRSKIHRHTREEYIGIRQWLLDGTTTSVNARAAPSNDLIAGRILSYTWHILFIPPTAPTTSTPDEKNTEGGINLSQLNKLACPDTQDCYCRLYRRCGLNGCKEGTCRGQYRVPPGFKVPERAK